MQDAGAAETFLAPDMAGRLRVAVCDGLPNGKVLAVIHRLEAAVDEVASALHTALHAGEPALLDRCLDLVLAAQRRALHIPDGPAMAPRFQELAAAWQANTLSADQLQQYERNQIAANIRFRLRVGHPELAQPPAPPDPDDVRLQQQAEALIGPLHDAQAHTVPGTITPAWLDRLEQVLAQHRALLGTAAPNSTYRPYLCYTMASAAYALGRARDQILQPREARDAYAEAARLYTESGEPDDAAAAAEQAIRLGFAVSADIDGATFADLRRVADGIADPLDRATAMHHLSLRAAAANDRGGALSYADAAAAALAQAGFPDAESAPIADIMAAWADAAISRRTGQAIVKLMQRVGDMTLAILATRHLDRLKTDPARAVATEAAISSLGAAIAAAVAEANAAAADLHAALLPYLPELRPIDLPEDPGFDRALALFPRVNALIAAVNAAAEPPESLFAEAAALVTEAAATGHPGLAAGACLAQAQLLSRRGDDAGSMAAAAAGEAALLPGASGPETLAETLPGTLTDPGLFGLFLTLRGHRLGLAAEAMDSAMVLDLAEGAIRAIEAARYRISDPFQQGAYLAERTRFYEMAAVAAFELERWDNLIAVMDLFRSRSALRNRLAPPPDDSVAALAKQVADATRAIEAAPDDARPALRDHRRILWSLLSIARLRGAAGQTLPELTVAAVQAALAPDEAVVAWVWVGAAVLIVLAVTRTKTHAERVILSEALRTRLARYVAVARTTRMQFQSHGSTVDTLVDALFPPATRDFVAGAARLILSPHRALHLLPFHAAHIGDRYLIERAAVRYVPNFASLILPWHGNDTGDVIAVGINAFGRPDVPTLKMAEAEAQSVAAAWAGRGARVDTLIGDAATRAAFTALPLDRCCCLHLATHGSSVFAHDTRGDPFASKLYFRDGEIEALTLADLPLRAALVVMSACNSGQRALDLPGLSELPGDDLFGLQAALFQAGVRDIIGALWPLNDAAAGIILPDLHQHLAAGLAPDQALRAAVCAYLQTPGTPRDIYFWAPLFMSSIGRTPGPTKETA